MLLSSILQFVLKQKKTAQAKHFEAEEFSSSQRWKSTIKIERF